jgi:heme exporter protein D
MSWGSASEFFAMGGYAFYVWGSFVVTGLSLSVEVVSLRARRERALERVRMEKERDEAAA